MHERHPLSAAFPDMPPSEFASLCEDVSQHGLRQAVVLLDGQVLDGWHRYRACLETGTEPRFEPFDGDDPVAAVVAWNIHRRHLTASQRAAAIVACSAWAPSHRPNKGAPGAPLFSTVAEMAEKAEVSVRTIQNAKQAHAAGLGEAVRDGKASAKRAAQVAKLPERQRAKALESPPDEAPSESEPDAEAQERIANIASEYASLLRIVESDDRVAEAWAEVKALTEQLDDMRRLHDAARAELAAMTKEAKRWMRKAQALEKGAGRAG